METREMLEELQVSVGRVLLSLETLPDLHRQLTEINKHLVSLNGSVASNKETIADVKTVVRELPCAARQTQLAILDERVNKAAANSGRFAGVGLSILGDIAVAIILFFLLR